MPFPKVIGKPKSFTASRNCQQRWTLIMALIVSKEIVNSSNNHINILPNENQQDFQYTLSAVPYHMVTDQI